MTFREVRLVTNEYTYTGRVDQIELLGFDLVLRADIKTDRDVQQARLMACALDARFDDQRRHSQEGAREEEWA